ncbi:hypothetical protein FJZ21_03030 [Candidatus Pacearchaeota archaeon]|nr:hypothetical protein [Candidatus Pacearchaeota archaeon]
MEGYSAPKLEAILVERVADFLGLAKKDPLMSKALSFDSPEVNVDLVEIMPGKRSPPTARIKVINKPSRLMDLEDLDLNVGMTAEKAGLVAETRYLSAGQTRPYRDLSTSERERAHTFVEHYVVFVRD